MRFRFFGLLLLPALLLLLLPAALALPSPEQAGPMVPVWQSEVVDGGGGSAGEHLAVARDAWGRVHIAYYDPAAGRLRYLYQDGFFRRAETVGDAGDGRYVALAVDAQGRPHLAYAGGDQHLYHAWNDGTSWQRTGVDATVRVGSPVSLALDGAGRPRIAYYDDTFSGERLRYAAHDGAAWQIETVQSGTVGLYPSLAPDAAGHPHIAGYDQANGNLLYFYHDGTAWNVETVESSGTVGKYPSLVLDAAGRPHISYYVGFSDYDLHYAYSDGSTWQIETPDAGGDVGTFTALALDSAGRAQIAYYAPGSNEVRLAVREAIWQVQTVATLPADPDPESHPLGLTVGDGDEPCLVYADGAGGLVYTCREGNAWQPGHPAGDAGHHASLALDAAGRPHLAYYDATRGDLRYASFDGATWQTEVVAGNGDVGQHAALALDAAGHPHLVAYDATGDALLYVVGDGSGWQQEGVAGRTGVGQYAALALDGVGRPHVACLDETADTLFYAYRDGGTWQGETVAAAGNGVRDLSLALDGANRPHVAYYDALNGDLRYARRDGVAWQVEVVDDGGDVGRYVSLALDAAARPHIAYYDATQGDLRYASFDGASWQVQVVDGGGDVGQYTSLALDGAGRPHIAYDDADAGDLRYATLDGSGWLTATVAGAGDVGRYASLVLDAAGQPHIAFYNATEGTLSYARPWGTPVGLWSKVVFISTRDEDRGELYTADGDGGNLFRVTADGAIDAVPEFNRGGTQIVFASFRDWDMEIYKISPDGSGRTRLTHQSGTDYAPTWSPDGTRIAFYSWRDGNAEVYRMNADGSGVTRLTQNPAYDAYPAWSPEGTRIAFVSDRNGTYSLWTMNSDGSGQAELVAGLEEVSTPAWSPEGTRIAFSCKGNDDGWDDLCLVNADGSGLTYPLGFSPYAVERLQPAWAPDGSGLAFTQATWDNPGGTWQIIAQEVRYLNLSEGRDRPFLDTTVDSWPHLTTPDTSPPTCQVNALPAWSAPLLLVSWGGQDGGAAGVASFDLQYRVDGGNWNDWLAATTAPAAAFAGEAGHTYAFRCRARDRAGNLGSYSGGVSTRSDGTPPTSAASSPAYATEGQFTVSWSGSDGQSGVTSYDLQYRDGAAGPWTDWLTRTTATSALFTGQSGHTYYFRARARDNVGNLEPYPPGDGDTATTVDTVPPESAASSPEYADAPAFVVSWSGTDDASGIASYDLQFRDGAAGPWTDWLTQTTALSATFSGEIGHTYYFRSRARDNVGNLEPYPSGDGDTHTHTPLYTLEGTVQGNREQPVAQALVVAAPPILNAARTDVAGRFALYCNVTGTTVVTATRSGFGPLPPVKGVLLSEAPPDLALYLPPADDRVADGGFEAGDLAAWETGGEIAPILTATAHSGDYALHLGGVVPPPVVTPTEAFAVSGLFTPAGGLLQAPLADLLLPAGALARGAILTLSGVPTVTALPGGTQDVGVHVSWAGVFTAGPPLTQTNLPVTLTVRYADAAWRDARVTGEETLALWRYDPAGPAWLPLSTTLDTLSNTAIATTTQPGLYALLGAPSVGPWSSTIRQSLFLPTSDEATLSFLYRPGAVAPSDTLQVRLVGPTGTLTWTPPLTPTGWAHRWWALPDWGGATLTLEVRWEQAGEAAAGVLVDEVSLGTAATGSFGIYLPLVRK